MKKHIMVVVFIIMTAWIPFNVFADVSLGIGVGTPAAFVTTRVQLDRVTSAVLNIGFGNWSNEGMHIRPQMQFEQRQRSFQIERQYFYPYLGIAAPITLKTNPHLGVSGVLGLSYYVGDGPVEIYLEALPTLRIVRSGDVGLGLGMGASLGVRYTL